MVSLEWVDSVGSSTEAAVVVLVGTLSVLVLLVLSVLVLLVLSVLLVVDIVCVGSCVLCVYREENVGNERKR